VAKILLVEDDNNLREIYEARLSAEGYEIVAAQNGEDALVLAKQHHPDLVISDVMMPRISGYEMLDILRNTDELKHTKVIMLTALGQNEDKERAGKLGADKYLVKSQVTLEDIVNSAKALLADDSVGSPQFTTPDASDPLGMATTLPQDDTTLSSVSSVAATVTPLASPPEPPIEPTPGADTPAVEPATQPEAQPTAVEPMAEAPTAPPVIEPAQSAEEPFASTVVEPEQTTSTPPVAGEDPQPTTAIAPSTDPISVDELINEAPTAAEAPGEVTQAELSDAQSTETEQAAVEQQIASFAQSEPDATIGAPSTEPTPQPQHGNDAALTDALQTLTAEPATPAAHQTEVITSQGNSGGTTEDVPQTHDIEGLTGVTEVVEVPTEQHIDPAPSTSATVIQPVLSQPTSPATPQQSVANSTTSTSMTQTVVPTEMPQPVAEEPTVPENDGVNVVGKKVIQPLSSTTDKPDLEKLLAQEEAKQAGEVLPQPVVGEESAQTAPSKPQSGFDPNNIAL
jgi:CheY-like chemotaxis protein